jgi:hypothetical protein
MNRLSFRPEVPSPLPADRYSGASKNLRDSLNIMAVGRRYAKHSGILNHKRNQGPVTVHPEPTKIPPVSKIQLYGGIQSSKCSIRRAFYRAQ